jgi:hypothetical protein
VLSFRKTIAVASAAVAGVAISVFTVGGSATVSPWKAGMEQGNLADWYAPSTTESTSGDHGGGEYNSGGGDSIASNAFAHTGSWSAQQTINTSNGSAGTRLFRWREFRSLEDGEAAYISVWVYLPQTVKVGGYINLFQFKSKTQDGRYVDVFFQLNIEDRNDGSLYLRPGWGWGAENPSYPGGPYSGDSAGGKWYQPDNAINIPIGQWFRVIGRVVPSAGYGGRMTFWQDNGTGSVLIYDFQNVRTGYANSNSVNGVDTQWAVNAYGSGLTPSTYKHYVDDAAIDPDVTQSPTTTEAATTNPPPATTEPPITTEDIAAIKAAATDAWNTKQELQDEIQNLRARGMSWSNIQRNLGSVRAVPVGKTTLSWQTWQIVEDVKNPSS